MQYTLRNTVGPIAKSISDALVLTCTILGDPNMRLPTI